MVRSGSCTVLALVLIACSQDRVTERDTPAVPVAIVVSGSPDAAGASGAMKVVRIEFGSGVQYRQEMTSTSPGGMKKTTTVNGHPFEVIGNEIRIGPRRYGPVAVGDTVLIDTDGVRINGTLSGPLP